MGGRETDDNQKIDNESVGVDNKPPRATEPSDSEGDDEEHEEDQQKQVESTNENPDVGSIERQQSEQSVQLSPLDDARIETLDIEEIDWNQTSTQDITKRGPKSGALSSITVPTTSVSASGFEPEPGTVEHQINPLRQTASTQSIPVLQEVQSNRATSHVQIPATSEYEDGLLANNQSDAQFDLLIMEEDPVYEWTGGSPYGNRRPKFIIHRDVADGESLAYLKRVLRDNFKTIHGGEPAAETIDFVANKPQFPTVSNQIVVLDIRGDEWSISSTGDGLNIKRHDRDILPALKELASSMFTGNLGYFILNLASDWFDPLTMPADQFLTDLRSELATATSETTPNEVSVAKPKGDRSWHKISQTYFGLDETVVEDNESVAETEARYEQLLHRITWEPVSLTKLQTSSENSDGESDEHYLYKAALVDSLAYDLFEATDTAENEYGTFVNRLLTESETIHTEKAIEEDISKVPDITIKNDGVDITVLSETFFAGETLDNIESIAIEFETGRQQAAFNYRKIRATLEKYRGSDPIDCDLVAIIVPPALLHMGKDRATQLHQLVAEWNNLDAETTHGAKLLIPQFGAKLRKTGEYRPAFELNPAPQLLDELYP